MDILSTAKIGAEIGKSDFAAFHRIVNLFNWLLTVALGSAPAWSPQLALKLKNWLLEFTRWLWSKLKPKERHRRRSTKTSRKFTWKGLGITTSYESNYERTDTTADMMRNISGSGERQPLDTCGSNTRD